MTENRPSYRCQKCQKPYVPFSAGWWLKDGGLICPPCMALHYPCRLKERDGKSFPKDGIVV